MPLKAIPPSGKMTDHGSDEEGSGRSDDGPYGVVAPLSVGVGLGLLTHWSTPH